MQKKIAIMFKHFSRYFESIPPCKYLYSILISCNTFMCLSVIIKSWNIFVSHIGHQKTVVFIYYHCITIQYCAVELGRSHFFGAFIYHLPAYFGLDVNLRNREYSTSFVRHIDVLTLITWIVTSTWFWRQEMIASQAGLTATRGSSQMAFHQWQSRLLEV